METLRALFTGLAVPVDEIIDKKLIPEFSRKGAKGSEGAQLKIFEQRWQLFSWLAFIGITKYKRVPIEKSNTDIFKYDTIFSQNEDIAHGLILAVLASEEDNSLSLLDKPKDVVHKIGEFAKGGAEWLLSERSKGNKLSDDESLFNELFGREPKE